MYCSRWNSKTIYQQRQWLPWSWQKMEECIIPPHTVSDTLLMNCADVHAKSNHSVICQQGMDPYGSSFSRVKKSHSHRKMNWSKTKKGNHFIKSANIWLKPCKQAFFAICVAQFGQDLKILSFSTAHLFTADKIVHCFPHLRNKANPPRPTDQLHQRKIVFFHTFTRVLLQHKMCFLQIQNESWEAQLSRSCDVLAFAMLHQLPCFPFESPFALLFPSAL